LILNLDREKLHLVTVLTSESQYKRLLKLLVYLSLKQKKRVTIADYSS